VYNKKETAIFYTAELMIEQNKRFEDAAKIAGLSEEQKENIIKGATTTRMPIKDYMKHVSFYDKPSSREGRLLRWWLEKTLAEQILFISFIIGAFLLIFGRFMLPMGNWHDYMAAH